MLRLIVLDTLLNQVRKIGHHGNTTEIHVLLADNGTGISGSFLPIDAVVGVLEIMHNNFVELFLFCSCWAIDDHAVAPTCSLRNPATQDV